jgi:hypothetical protein
MKHARADHRMTDYETRLLGTIADRIDVDTGFRDKASYALRQCFPDKAGQYINECFEVKPDEDRLYQIRNAINHGDINASNPEELIRVKDKQLRLWNIVFGMLGQIIPIPTPC